MFFTTNTSPLAPRQTSNEYNFCNNEIGTTLHVSIFLGGGDFQSVFFLFVWLPTAELISHVAIRKETVLSHCETPPGWFALKKNKKSFSIPNFATRLPRADQVVFLIGTLIGLALTLAIA